MALTFDPDRPGKPLSARQRARFAYALASGNFTYMACCRNAGIPCEDREQARQIVRKWMGNATFARKVEALRYEIEREERDMRATAGQVRAITKDWVLARLRKVHLQACAEMPIGVGDDGNERYLNAPNFAAAIRSLNEIAKILKLHEEPAHEYDELAQELQAIAEERRALN